MRTVVALTIAFVLVPVAIARAQTVDDTKVWLTAGVDADVSTAVSLSAEQELRAGAESSFDQTHTEIAVQFSATRWLRFGALYRFIVLDGEQRHRIGADAEPTVDVGRVRLRWRARLQATTRENDDTQIMLRNRLKADVRVARGLRPFAAVEEHYQLDPKAEHRELRIYLGLDWRVRASIDLTAFYLYQTESNVAAPERNHIFGLGLTWHLRDLPASGKRGAGEKQGTVASSGSR